MNQRKERFFPLLGLFFLLCFMPVIVQATVEGEVSTILGLDKSPIGISTSRDGRWAFILTPGEVQVYAINTAALIGRIPVDTAISRINASANGDKLFLMNEKTKTLAIFSVAFSNMFTVTGSPFRGPVDAPVVITDFSDYQ